MKIADLMSIGATVVGGQVDLHGTNIGICLPGGEVELSERGKGVVSRAAPSPTPAAFPAEPAAEPAKPAKRHPRAKAPAVEAAPVEADPMVGLDDLIGN